MLHNRIMTPNKQEYLSLRTNNDTNIMHFMHEHFYKRSEECDFGLIAAISPLKYAALIHVNKSSLDRAASFLYILIHSAVFATFLLVN